MEEDDQLQLTNGKGKVITAKVIVANKKATQVEVLSASNIPHRIFDITIAISLIKNISRFEWFLEKATEIGVSNVTPIICERTEKQHFRYDRMKAILISAMLQSQQVWLPLLNEPVTFKEFVSASSQKQKFIAHCIDEEKKELGNQIFSDGGQLMLIGPEGDFTKAEVEFALQNNYIPVSLGSTRLRTETAGIVACVLLNSKKAK